MAKCHKELRVFTWNNEGEELFSSPEWLWLEDGWDGQLAVPRRQEHHKVHHLSLNELMKQLCIYIIHIFC